MIIVNPKEFGHKVIKSIATSSHTYSGIGKGYSKHAGNVFSSLACWHTTQLLIKCFTSSFNLGQKNCDVTLATFQVILVRPLIGDEWYSCKKLISVFFAANDILPVHSNRPSLYVYCECPWDFAWHSLTKVYNWSSYVTSLCNSCNKIGISSYHAMSNTRDNEFSS